MACLSKLAMPLYLQPYQLISRKGENGAMAISKICENGGCRKCICCLRPLSTGCIRGWLLTLLANGVAWLTKKTGIEENTAIVAAAAA